jgi:glycine oxidase
MAAGLPFRPGSDGCTFDVAIAGAGIIGLSIALELRRRGAQVLVLERDAALRHASTAAAGMLAAEDPHNPAALLPLSRYSVALYPEYLRRIERLSGLAVPFQTETTWQYAADGTRLRLAERSVDPRQLAKALLAAVRATDIELREGDDAGFEGARERVIAAGAWSGGTDIPAGPLPVAPRKGQMLRVKLPPGVELTEVHRSERVYVVPRTRGPQAGTALIGATVEDAGFDVSTDAEDLAKLRAWGAELVPELDSASEAPMAEAWAGLRSMTPDQLPLLGRWNDSVIATGHFRNGILLAPATAMAIADLLEGKQPAVDLSAFAPGRSFEIAARL